MESTAPDSDLPADSPGAGRQHLRRELIVLGIALLTGLLIVPILIWTAGHAALGPYNGGPGRLLADFLTGLAHGSPIFWAVALGPYVLTLLVRYLYWQVRGSR